MRFVYFYEALKIKPQSSDILIINRQTIVLRILKYIFLYYTINLTESARCELDAPLTSEVDAPLTALSRWPLLSQMPFHCSLCWSIVP